MKKIQCVLNLEKLPQKRMECFRLLLEHLAWIEHQFLSGIRDSRKAGSLRDDERCGRSKEVNTPELIGQWWRRGQHSSNRVSGISSRTMLQSTTPSLSQTLWTRWYLWLSVIPWAQRLSLWDNWGDERGCDEGHWHTHTRGLPCGPSRSCWNNFHGAFQKLLEHWSRRRLLRRGLEFHVCIINKSAPAKKKLWQLI